MCSDSPASNRFYTTFVLCWGFFSFSCVEKLQIKNTTNVWLSTVIFTLDTLNNPSASSPMRFEHYFMTKTFIAVKKAKKKMASRRYCMHVYVFMLFQTRVNFIQSSMALWLSGCIPGRLEYFIIFLQFCCVYLCVTQNCAICEWPHSDCEPPSGNPQTPNCL